MNIIAVVPSFCPDHRLPELTHRLADAGFCVVVVDDGSGPAYASFFAGMHPGATLLRHPGNLGKGRALKTAFSAVLERFPNALGVVTVDGDGQHDIGDVLRCADALEQNPNALILGARSFSGRGVPARSRFGNRVTRWIFRLICGLSLTDTQTGLRAIPVFFCRHLLGTGGERYEFETNMLLQTKSCGIPIREVAIQTIYHEKNASSHFRPLRDSLRIYALMLRCALFAQPHQSPQEDSI